MACLNCGALPPFKLHHGKDNAGARVALSICTCGSYFPIQLTDGLRATWAELYAERGCHVQEATA